jgi:transcription elongation factor GreA-like protein
MHISLYTLLQKGTSKLVHIIHAKKKGLYHSLKKTVSFWLQVRMQLWYPRLSLQLKI